MILSLKKEIDSLYEKTNRLDIEIPELQCELEAAEEELEHAEARLQKYLQRLTWEVVEAGKNGSGNDFVDTARLLSPYVGSAEFDDYIFQGYFIENDVIIGTNGNVAFEAKVKTPSELQGKYLQYEFVYEPEKIDKYIYTVPYKKGIETIRKMMDKTYASMDKEIEVRNINSIVTKEDKKATHVKLGDTRLSYWPDTFKYLGNIFRGKITIKWLKEFHPIYIEDDKTKMVIAPLKFSSPTQIEKLEDA